MMRMTMIMVIRVKVVMMAKMVIAMEITTFSGKG